MSKKGEIIIKEIKAFECEYCNKYYKHKSSARAHEKKCTANPENKACRTCENFHIEWNTVYVPPVGDQSYGDGDYEEKQFWCNEKDKRIEDPEDWQKHCSVWKHGRTHF